MIIEKDFNKELFAAVMLPLEVFFVSIKENKINFKYNAIGEIREDKINIYEFIHKCKDWAWEQEVRPSNLNHYAHKTSLACWQIDDKKFSCRVSNTGECKTVFHCESNTEEKAILIACEWILESREV